MHGDAEPGPVTSRRAYTRRNKKETCKLLFKYHYIIFKLIFTPILIDDDDDDEGSDQDFG